MGVIEIILERARGVWPALTTNPIEVFIEHIFHQPRPLFLSSFQLVNHTDRVIRRTKFTVPQPP